MTAITDRQLMRALVPALRGTHLSSWIKGDVVELDIYDRLISTVETLSDGGKLQHRYDVRSEFESFKRRLGGAELEDLPRVLAEQREELRQGHWYLYALTHLLEAV